MTYYFIIDSDRSKWYNSPMVTCNIENDRDKSTKRITFASTIQPVIGRLWKPATLKTIVADFNGTGRPW